MKRHLLFAITLCLPAAAVAEQPWVRHTIDNSSRGADGVKFGDIDGDGDADIVTPWEEGGVVRVYLRPPDEQIRQPWPAVTVGRVGSPEEAIFFDTDGDGTLEVVSLCEGKTRAIFVHRPSDRSRLLEESAWQTERVAAADGQMWMQALPIETSDGPALIVGSKGSGGSISLLYPPDKPSGHGSWRLKKLVDAGWIMSIMPCEVDPAIRYVIVSDRKGPRAGVWAFDLSTLNGAHSAEQPPVRLLGGAGDELLFGDLGRLKQHDHIDAVFAVKGGELLILTPATTLDRNWTASGIPMPAGVGGGKSARIVDLNGDSRNDLVVSCESANGKIGVFWLEQNQSSTVESTAWTFHDISGVDGTKFDRIEIADFNGDSYPDVITCEERENLGLFWYENPGIPQFGANE